MFLDNLTGTELVTLANILAIYLSDGLSADQTAMKWTQIIRQKSLIRRVHFIMFSESSIKLLVSGLWGILPPF